MTTSSIVLTKIVLATLVALIAEVVRRRSSRPDFAYVLWASVLAVLVVPAIIVVPVPETLASSIGAMLSSVADSLNLTLAGDLSLLSPELTAHQLAETSSVGLLLQLMIVGWGVGFLLKYYCRVRALRHLASLLRLANEAPDSLSERCRQLTELIGVRVTPRLVTASGTFSPFLWHPIRGTATIVLPSALIGRLSEESLDAVMLHELTHLRRRDAWRHRIQFFVGALWWWLPTAAFARRRLSELEELCTDCEVVRAQPENTRAYATALLDAEEFLSQHKCDRLAVVPAFAQSTMLKERIEFIVSGQREEAGWPVRASAMGAVAVILSLSLLTASLPDKADNTVADGEPPPPSSNLITGTLQDSPMINGSSSAVLPDSDSVRVLRTESEITLAWPDSKSVALNEFSTEQDEARQEQQTRTIRLVRISEAGIEPQLWQIQHDGESSSEGLPFAEEEVEWLFGFLALNNDLIDRNGTRHNHPGRTANVA